MFLLGWAMFTTWWFWIAAGWLVLVIFSVLNEQAAPPLIGLVVGLAALHFLGKYEVWDFLKNNWTDMLMYSGIYVVAGLGWSFFKWYMFLVDAREEYIKSRDHLINNPVSIAVEQVYLIKCWP